MTEDKTLHCSAPQLVCLWKIEVMRVLPHGCHGNEKKGARAAARRVGEAWPWSQGTGVGTLAPSWQGVWPQTGDCPLCDSVPSLEGSSGSIWCSTEAGPKCTPGKCKLVKMLSLVPGTYYREPFPSSTARGSPICASVWGCPGPWLCSSAPPVSIMINLEEPRLPFSVEPVTSNSLSWSLESSHVDPWPRYLEPALPAPPSQEVQAPSWARPLFPGQGSVVSCPAWHRALCSVLQPGPRLPKLPWDLFGPVVPWVY